MYQFLYKAITVINYSSEKRSLQLYLFIYQGQDTLININVIPLYFQFKLLSAELQHSTIKQLCCK